VGGGVGYGVVFWGFLEKDWNRSLGSNASALVRSQNLGKDRKMELRKLKKRTKMGGTGNVKWGGGVIRVNFRRKPARPVKGGDQLWEAPSRATGGRFHNWSLLESGSRKGKTPTGEWAPKKKKRCAGVGPTEKRSQRKSIRGFHMAKGGTGAECRAGMSAGHSTSGEDRGLPAKN